MQNILFFLLCALLTGCHAGTSRPELPEMVEYSGPNASSLRTFIESIEVIKLDQLKSEDIKNVELITSPGARYDASVKAVIRKIGLSLLPIH